MLNYVNYHSHSQYSNVSTPDCTITNKQRGDRALELGQTVIGGIEHGWVGRFIEIYEYAKENGLKPLFGTEAYFVKDRFEKDRTNAHVIILARNEDGRKEINWILSEANVTGFYYKARVDMALFLTLNPKNVWITTSCLGGVWKYEDHEEIIKSWKNHFGESLFLEVQPHYTEEQRELNRKVLRLSKMLNIKIIAGMDSHMIYPEQAKERDDYLLSRGIEYPDEQGWFLDYPSYDEAKGRFIVQGVLSEEKIVEALENTNVLCDVQPYTSIIFDDDKIKLPSLYPDKTLDEKYKILLGILREEWEKEKKNIPQSQHKLYEQEIKKELEVVKATGMADYFILDYQIVKRGKELGGSITLTGRGSAPSFYLTKLLGLTTIDRIGASVKLFPERFISKERLLQTKSLPDIDLNLGTPDIFAEAQEQIMGIGHSYKMIAFGTVRTSGAWKLYARVAGVDFDTSNLVSEKLREYEYALKHAESEEDISVYDYIDSKYHKTFDESRKYLGLVNTLTPHPCAYLLFTDEDIRKEFGLIKIKTGNVEHICANVDGLFAEKYKMLKNDLLKVSVVDLIHKVYKRIGIEPHPITQLLQLCEGDDEVWEIYEKALGMGINQVEQSGTIGRVAKYRPRNISELSAFVAAIRPGFKSNYKRFEAREPFAYGVETIDKLIQTEEFPQSYMLYQENAMQIMAYAGISISETYDVIKNIAKKRADKVYKYKTIFIEGMTKRIIEQEGYAKEDAEKIAHDTWQIIEDSAFYSFNACVSGTTKIQKLGVTKSKFNPSIEEMFFIKNNREYAKATGHLDLYYKYQYNGYGNALSMFEDGKIRVNKIVDIYCSGVQDTYRVTTSSGSSIICTENHKFPTERGSIELKNLNIGDTLYVKGRYEMSDGWHGFTDSGFIKNTPLKGQKGFQKNPDGQSVLFREYRTLKVNEKHPCEECGKAYSKNKKFELHHIDGDRTNNSKKNLSWLCNSCHKKADYKRGRTKVYEKGVPALLEDIVSIEFVCTESVYDIEMENPAHNFVSENGLVTSNSHSYAVAGDSLYGAYLKAKYPYEFYEVFLNMLEENGDKDRLASVKEEAEHAFGINFPNYEFGQDNRGIVANRENKTISSSLKSLKGFNHEISENLYVLSQRTYDSFVDFLVHAEETCGLSSKFEKLIAIDYFKIFGNNEKLMTIWNEFRTGKNKYTKKLTEKSKTKRLIALHELEANTENTCFTFSKQIEYDLEVIGKISRVYPELNKNVFHVFDVNDGQGQYAPRVELRSLKTGKLVSAKISKQLFQRKPIMNNVIIQSLGATKKPSVKYVDGDYVEQDTFTYWLNDYNVVKNIDLLLKG